MNSETVPFIKYITKQNVNLSSISGTCGKLKNLLVGKVTCNVNNDDKSQTERSSLVILELGDE